MPVLGSQMKMRARLGVLETPVGLNGPAISTPSRRSRHAVEGRRAAGQAAIACGFAKFSSDSTWERSMNATTTSRTPASHLHGNLREALHDLGASGAGLAIGESLIRRPADRLAKHDRAIDHDDERALILECSGVRAHPRSLILMRYSPSAGKLCLNRMPPRVPGGSGFVGILIGRDGVLHTRNARIGIADREPRHLPRRGDVLIEERGRHAQSGRDIVEAVHLDVLRQNFLRVHVHPHQRFHRRGVLGAVQALDRHIARLGTFGMSVERCSPSRPTNESTSFCVGWGLPGGGI